MIQINTNPYTSSQSVIKHSYSHLSENNMFFCFLVFTMWHKAASQKPPVVLWHFDFGTVPRLLRLSDFGSRNSWPRSLHENWCHRNLPRKIPRIWLEDMVAVEKWILWLRACIEKVFFRKQEQISLRHAPKWMWQYVAMWQAKMGRKQSLQQFWKELLLC